MTGLVTVQFAVRDNAIFYVYVRYLLFLVEEIKLSFSFEFSRQYLYCSSSLYLFSFH